MADGPDFDSYRIQDQVLQSTTTNSNSIHTKFIEATNYNSFIDISDEEFQQHINKLDEKIQQEGFKPILRDIHCSQAQKFYRTVLQAPQEILMVLSEGYVPSYTSRPPPSSAQNNASAQKYMTFCCDQVSFHFCLTYYYSTGQIFVLYSVF